MKRRRHKPGAPAPAQGRASGGPPQPETRAALPAAAARGRGRVWGISLLLALGAWLVFSPVWRFEFFRFDDPQYILDNPAVKAGLTGPGLAWALRATQAGNWHPLTWVSHMLDCQLFGVHAGWFHLVNATFHALNAALLFLALRQLTGATWRSALVAALFALHPLRVESVAWISERKDVLSGFFFMLTLWAYARYARPPGPEERDPTVPARGAGRPPLPASLFYGLALVCFALGLLSKPMLVTVPLVLGLLDFWPLQRVPRRGQRAPGSTAGMSAWSLLALEKVPFLTLALVQSGITLWAQKAEGAMATADQLRLSWRLGNALVAYVRYLRKMIWPDQLAFLYPHPGAWPVEQVAGAAGVLLLVCLGMFWLGRRRRYWLVGGLWFFGMLVPVIGLVQVGQQSWADRYSYLPSIGLLIILAWGLGDLAEKHRRAKGFVIAGAAALLAASTVATARQLPLWKSTEPLYCRALDVALRDAVYRRAYETIPLYMELHLSFARDWAEVVQTAEEKAQLAAYLRKWARLKPESAPVHLLLSEALARQGNWEEAVAEFNKAARLDPNVVRPPGAGRSP
ncbi:MAG TPA: tetratricopeptide repeat protein [Verrucomicrobiota bacterium]|nr:tetratricopeptide repeat protein [Verrucomicrobiota bacterium]